MYLVNCMYLNPGDIVNGRYKVISKLGKGGFGTTYSAYDNQQSPPLIVVLKQIRIIQSENNEAERDNDYIRRLRLEADTLRNLQHPCIPKFFDSFEEDKYYYIVQEYIEGDELSKEILPGEPIGEEEAESILREILEILQFVHENNIIHRDVKPANIIRRKINGKLYLIDFGAVKEIATEHTNAAGNPLTKAIISMGYTPPEQLAGQPKLNSDIYALGITIMQAITGFTIRAIDSRFNIPTRDNQGNYIWEDYAPQISPRFKAIISRMIPYSFCDRDRYQSVAEILQDLNRESPPPDDHPPAPLSKSFYTRYRKRIKFAIIAIVTCFALIIFSIQSITTISQSFLKLSNAFGTNNKTCSLELEDNISCGEEILDPLSKGAIRRWAAEQHQQKKYTEATKYFQKSWQKERRDAETLIYLNNSLLDANKIDHYTIAVAVPLSFNKIIKSSETAQDFLRGVAQVQTEVNLNLSKINPEIKNQLSPYNFLTYRSISQTKNKGLKVIIVDDANNKEQAKQVAQKIANRKGVLGIIGHYTSRMTLNTVDIYQQKQLAQISYGTTTKELTENPKNNFFRVVYTNEEEADALLKYIEQNDLAAKRIAIFYNPNSEYSNRFKIELETKIENLGNPNIKIINAFDLADENYFSASSALKQIVDDGVNICLLLPDGQVSNSLAKAIDVLKLDNGERLILGANVLINSKVNQIETTRPLNLIVTTFWHSTADLASTFNQQTQQLWGNRVNGGTAMAYDATLAMLEAIKRQDKPTRPGTIQQLSDGNFSVVKTATGEINFNTPKNGDRLNFYPTLVRLHKCQDGNNHFVTLSLDDTEASDLVCQSE